MSNGPIRPSAARDLSHPPECAGPDPSGEVELYWNRPPAPVRRDTAHRPRPAGGPHLLPDGPADPANLAGLWIDLGGGD